MADTNRQILLAARPQGFPKDSDFKLVETPVPQAGPGQYLARNLWVSVDPYMRGRMNDVKSYVPPVPLNGVMEGGTVSRVVASNNPKFKVGDIVEGRLGWQDYGVTDGKGTRVIDPTLAPVSTALGVLGMPGLTAYFGLLDIAYPKAGETVVVSGAAGAVGSIVGQIAKIVGCRVVGIAGEDDKCRWVVDELGFDACYNYKTTKNHVEKLRELCPKGVDVYFDNVGGPITDAVINVMNTRSRISVCGQISQYNNEKMEMGPRFLFHTIAKQMRIEGFLVFQFADRYREGLTKMAEWMKSGQLKYKESIVTGLENTPRAFMGMLKGENTGKQLVKVAE